MLIDSMRRPLLVILDITERCNLKCRMCHFTNHDRLRFPPFDLELDPHGNMPLEVFEKIADELFPKAWRVALACASEPLVHPKFTEILDITARHKVKDVWFPTNLLTLTQKKAEAICDAGVKTVGVSIDGMTPEVYEHIRIGGKFARLEKCLALLNEVRKGTRTQVRLTFTWMKSNRNELSLLAPFAEKWGASELDVRFVVPTPGVDVTPELLDAEDPAKLRKELRECALDASRRGIRLGQFPSYEEPEEVPQGWIGRARRNLWRWRVGLERFEYVRFRQLERMQGCTWPSYIYVVRPNGVVAPCQFWEEDGLGFFPEASFASLSGSKTMHEIKQGLKQGKPVGTCATCSQRKDAFYWGLRRRKADEPATPQGPVALESPPGGPEGLVELGRD